MMSGFLSPWETLLIDLNIANYFNKWKNIWEHFQKYDCSKSKMLETKNYDVFVQIWKSRGPMHDDDPSKNFVKSWI